MVVAKNYVRKLLAFIITYIMQTPFVGLKSSAIEKYCFNIYLTNTLNLRSRLSQICLRFRNSQ